MKRKIAIAAVLMVCAPLLAIEGEIGPTNNHWGTGGNVASPVTVEGVVTVPVGQVLTIEAGTQIQGSFGIEVQGNIIVLGTKAGRVSFNQNVSLTGVQGARFEFADFNASTLDCGTSGVTLKFCRFTGGLDQLTLNSCTFTVENSIFSGAEQSAFRITGGSGTVKNCDSYTTNASTVHFLLAGSTALTITNCILSEGTYGIFTTEAQSMVTVKYSILKALVQIYGQPNTVTTGAGVQSGVAPLFVNAAAGDFHLQGISPGVDAGDPADAFVNEPEGGGGRIDIGAYGNTDEATKKVGVESPALPSAALFSLAASPNPFTARGNISFSLSRAGRVTLAVYGADGTLAKVLAEGDFTPGFHSVSWDGTNARGFALPSGPYFCRLNCGKNTLTQRLNLLR